MKAAKSAYCISVRLPALCAGSDPFCRHSYNRLLDRPERRTASGIETAIGVCIILFPQGPAGLP